MSDSKNTLLNAYLIVGEDELKRQHALERLRKRIAELGDLEFNHDEFDGESATGTEIAAACNTLPFASELRLVEVKNGEKLSAAEQKVLEAYLSAPSESTVLAFSCNKLAKNTRLYKAFASYNSKAIIDCAPMKKFELARALRSMATGYGFALTESSAAKLIELVGEDTLRLDAELRRLSLATTRGETLDTNAIEQMVTRTAEAKPWDLTDALARRDLYTALSLIPVLEDAPLKHLSMCVTRLRELACAKSLSERGELSLLPQVLGVPAWRVKNHGSWVNNYTEDELRKAIIGARDCEQSLKSSSSSIDPFSDWLIKVIA